MYTTRGGLVLAFCLLGGLPLVVCGFSSLSAGALKRSLAQRVSLTNAPLLVTVTFSNSAEQELHGFFFSEQVPSSLSVDTVAITLNGQPVTNYLVESGLAGDLLPGYTPWRWCFETPTNFLETNPIPGPGTAQIVYTLTSSSPGTVSLPGFSWAAKPSDLTNTVFGYSEEADNRLLRFVDQTNLPLLRGGPSPENYTLTVDGAPGAIYLLSASTDLVTWAPVATNLSPFVFIDTNWADFPRRFYRAAPFASFSAALHLGSFSGQGRLVRVSGVTGCRYVLERSANLVDWLPVSTNLAPFSFLDTNTVGLVACFYRGRLLYEP